MAPKYIKYMNSYNKINVQIFCNSKNIFNQLKEQKVAYKISRGVQCENEWNE